MKYYKTKTYLLTESLYNYILINGKLSWSRNDNIKNRNVKITY